MKAHKFQTYKELSQKKYWRDFSSNVMQVPDAEDRYQCMYVRGDSNVSCFTLRQMKSRFSGQGGDLGTQISVSNFQTS